LWLHQNWDVFAAYKKSLGFVWAWFLFKSHYLYGAVAPQTGESFWLEFSHLDSLCFQIFLEQLAGEYPDNLNVVQLDNGRFHYSSSLTIPTTFY
jgi:hypothetical protein